MSSILSISLRPLMFALSLTVLSACAATAPATLSPRQLPPPPPFSGTLGPSELDLVTFSGTWPATQRILNSAVAQLNRTCLADQGFDYPVDRATPPPVDDDAVIDLPGRRANGYGISGSKPAPPVTQADRYVDSLPPEQQRRFQTALLGPPGTGRTIDLPDGSRVTVPDQGCEATSRTQLTGDLARWAQLTYIPEFFYNRMAAQLDTRPVFRAARTEWRSCMATRGYDYQTPEQAWQALNSETDTATNDFREREIATAIADGECASRAHLPAAALAARRELATTMPEADRETLHDLAYYRDAIIERATSN
ncbi:hypothetical protein ACFWF7_21560 [Nocardia sp. NPDC060256]|uniref:hypothetical protein n=1 Tax=unclassified Nocardia TaxID=2637762 RepID=UPI0036583D92